MNRIELKKKLEEEDFNPDAYSIDGFKLDAVCLSESYGSWFVTYYEPTGIPTLSKQFKSEQEACDYLYEILNNDPTTRKSG